ncbi:MAG: cation:proton antiporter [Solirubrobacterales bacterium]|nr:cation:proton antiporter [Solirubrobacterales bacterium]
MTVLAAAGPVAGLLTDLFVVLLAAKLGDELFQRLGQPGLVGEILAGIVIGPAVLGLVEPGEVLEVFAELGVVFLLFWVGLETRLSEMRDVGRSAALVGALGVALPFAGGIAFAAAIGEDGPTSVFVGVALVATSVGITSAVLIELGVLGGRAARTILGAAVIDDILAMLLLAVAVGLGADDGVDVAGLLVTVALALGFVAFFALGGTRVTARRPQILHAPRFSESPLLPAVIICLGLAAFSAQIGLAAIIGAFLAGMIVAETKEQHPIEEEVAPLYAFFPPFFFAFIGTEVELGELADPGTLVLLAAVTALAFATKYAGALLGSRGMAPADRRVVALGMVPRGEVGIIVAGIGATAGVIDDRLFAVIVAMSVLTTLLVPPLLRRALRAPGGSADPAA